MYAVSSNHYSVDQQIEDAVSSLTEPERAAFVDAYPEWPNLVWSGSWIDAETSCVDPEFMSWVADWIEGNTTIFWENGEPWRMEDEDEVTEWDY